VISTRLSWGRRAAAQPPSRLLALLLSAPVTAVKLEDPAPPAAMAAPVLGAQPPELAAFEPTAEAPAPAALPAEVPALRALLVARPAPAPNAEGLLEGSASEIPPASFADSRA